ncbi:MAG: sulfite exporter TauE/SafE family protein [Methylotenera sp.]
MSLELVVAFLLLGIVVGVMAGLLGIGGGGILVPAFTMLFIYQGFPKDNVVHIALGTSMACIAVTSFSSMRAHHANGAVIWRLAKVMIPGIIIGTFAATFLATTLSSKALAIFFALFMTYVSSQMFRNRKSHESTRHASKTELRLVAFGIGAISALVSIGGGSLTVPYLNWRSVEIKKAIGTSAALGFPIAIAGTFGYLINGLSDVALTEYTWGFIYLPAVLLVSIPSFFTAPFGARLTQRLPIQTLKKIFGVLLILLSLKMVTFIL